MLACLLASALLVTSCGLISDQPDEVLQVPLPTAPGLLPEEPAPASQEPGLVESVVPQPTQAVPAESAVVEPTPAPALSPLRCLSTRQRAAQLLLPLMTQSEIAGAEVYASSGELGGIGLLGQPDQGLQAALGSLQASSLHLSVMVASDEEGGSVQRLSALLGPLPSAEETARTKSVEQARNQWVEYGSRVSDIGIDVVFGPVLDVGAAPGIASRSFGDDPAVVTAYGQAMADGLLEAGVLPVFKHFPGHGRASADSHLELPATPSLGT